jgi:DNA-binding CsgD family transcriptional regulator
MIVDAEGLVVAANPIARRLVHASGGTLRLGPRLGSRQAGVESRLLRAVRSVATDAGPGVAFPIETAQGRMQITVPPLRARREHETRAVVFIQDRSLSELRALKSLDTRFDLTQAEQRVALQILTGHSAAAAARALGISPETVKSHLRSIFRKTSTGSQAEFVATVTGFTVS